MNLAQVPSCFPPSEETLTPTELALVREKGPPDFIRFWWLPTGDFITSSDLSGRHADLPQIMKESKRTWIYVDEDLEAEFVQGGGWVEHPLTEKLRLVARYGDPSVKSPPRPDPSGRIKETWQWYDVGIIIQFLDDQVISEKRVQATGRGTILGH